MRLSVCLSSGQFRTLVLACVFLLALGGATAQVIIPATQQGLPINTSNDEHGVDSVNTMGLGLHIEIPLLSIPEHGQMATWKYVYDSPTYSIHFYAQPTPQNSNNGNYAVQVPNSALKPSGSDNWRLVSSYNWSLDWDTIDSDDSGNPLGCTSGDTGGERDPWIPPDGLPSPRNNYIHFVNFRLTDPSGTSHHFQWKAGCIRNSILMMEVGIFTVPA